MKNSLRIVIVISLLVIITPCCDADYQLPLVVLRNDSSSFAYEYRFPECVNESSDGKFNYVCETEVAHQFKYYCSAQQSEIVKNKSGKNCLYPYELPLKEKTCPKDVPVEPEIALVEGPEGDSIECGKNENNKLYKFGYKICDDEQKENEDNFFHMVIYEFCFNHVSKKVIYVDYRIISPNIRNESGLKNISNFERDISHDDFDIDEFSRFEFLRMAHVEQNDMKRTMLIAPSHMALSHWKKPLYHEANIKLMKSGFISQWNYINRYIEIEAIMNYGEIRIKTGVFDSSESEVDANIWWKLVYDSEEKYAIAIILHNTDNPPSKEERKCECICDTANWGDIIHEDKRDFVYCCPPETIAKDMEFSYIPEVFDLRKGLTTALVLWKKKENSEPLQQYLFPFHTTNGFLPPDESYEVEYFCPRHSHETDSKFCLWGEPKHQYMKSKSDLDPNLHTDERVIAYLDQNYCPDGNFTPEIIPLKLDDTEVRCGKDGGGLSYQAAFRLCKSGDSSFMKIYGFCKRERNNEIIYLDYKIISPKLFENNNIKMEDEFSSHSRYFQALRKDNFSNKISPMICKMLIPSSHMALKAWKRAVAEFDYNYDYLHHTRAEDLDIVDDYIKQKAITILGDVRIKAGVMDSPDPSVKTKIWWKLVYDEKEKNAIAIIIHNTDEVEKRGKRLCETSVCPFTGWEFTSLNILKQLKKRLYLYCCPPDVITRRMALPDAKILNLNQPQ